MKTLHQLHNEEQAEAFRRDSVEFVKWSIDMDRTTRHLETLSVVLKALVWVLVLGLLTYVAFTIPT